MLKKASKLAIAAASAVTYMLMAAPAAAYSYDYYDSYDTTGSGIGALFGGMSCICWAVAMVFGLAALAFTVWMIIDVTKRDEKVLPKKNMWMLLMILLTLFTGMGWIVAVYYYFARKRKLDAMSAPAPSQPEQA